MKTSLTKGLQPLQAKEIEMEYLGSSALRKRLTELLMDKQSLLIKKRTSEEAYASPSWAYLQADQVGYLRALNEVISLISTKNVINSEN